MQTKPSKTAMFYRRLLLGRNVKQSSLAKLAGFVMLCAVMLLASRASAANILVNPGFESGGASWTIYTPQGAGGNVFETQAPTHGGVNVYKNWGCWCTDTNLNSVYQDKPSGAGNAYTASGFVRSGNNGDKIGGANLAWLEVDFLNAGGAILARYDSQNLDNTASTTDWTQCDITNHVDPVTGALLGTVSSLVAPAGTAKVRFYCKYLQLFGGGGSAQFDDMTLNQTGGNVPPSILSLAPNGTALFNLAANGITFTASSTTTNISPSGIKLILNGLDVSGGLAISPGGSVASQSVTYTGLSSNRLYSAVIHVTDGAGYLTSASVIFDTFVAGNFSWEAEDYDYNGGSYFNNPTPTSTNAANSYFGRPGTAEIDWHESGGWGGDNNQAYRELGVGPGVQWAQDIVRQKYLPAHTGGDTNVHDYDVGWVSGLDGDWMNYTRDVAAGSYNVYGRLAGGGGVNKCQLAVVTSGAGTTTQTTNVLGVMTMNGTGYQSWDWVPLADTGGNLIKLNYATASKVTFRASADGLNMNFFMLAPARTDLPLIGNLYPTGTKPFEPGNTLSFNASSGVATIPAGNIHVTLNGNDVDALLMVGSNATNRTVSLAVLASNAIYSATISVTDSAGTTVSRSINFDTFSESNFSFEAEDYNFGSGQYVASPVLSTTPGVNNYYALGIAAVEAIDISTNPPAGGYGIAYQRPDPVGTEVASDYLRQAYVAAQVGDPGVKDYDVGWDNPGTWFNYTRDIPAGNYRVYARLAGPSLLNATMDLVTGATSTNQTTAPLGTFASISGGWQSWVWVPLLSANGGPAIVSGGTKTLRFTTSGNVNHNYFLLVPAKNVISLSIKMSGGNPVISIPTQAGASYTIQYKNSATTGPWTYLTTVGGDGTTKTVTDTTASGSQRLYRAIIQ